MLERAGFAVDRIEPAPLPIHLGTGGLAAFIDTFCENFFRPLKSEDRPAAHAELIDLVRQALYDHTVNWVMDFVRIRFAAPRPVTKVSAMETLTIIMRCLPERIRGIFATRRIRAKSVAALT